MAGKGDATRVTNWEAYRSSPLWKNIEVKKHQFDINAKRKWMKPETPQAPGK